MKIQLDTSPAVSLFLAAVLAAAIPAHANTVLTSSKDTYINSASASTNYGTATTMVSNNNGTFRYALFSFDISSVTQTVSGVKLQLADNAGAAGIKSYQIYGLLDAQDGWDGWVENTLTWNSAVTAGFISGTAVNLAATYGGVKLGDFNTAQNASFTAFDVTSGPHVNFLNANRAENGGNNIITYIIVDPSNDVSGTGWATKESSLLKPTLTITTISGPPDTIPPTLSTTGITDNRNGGPVTIGTSVTYTVTFSEPMDPASITAADFGNAGTASFTKGSTTAGLPGVFTIQLTPTSTGTLQLMVLAGASLTDLAGNPLDTTSAIAAATTIDVIAESTPPTLSATGITDNRNGGPVTIGTSVTYTLTFSEPMNPASITAADFGNAGTASFTMGSPTAGSPGVFTIQLTPTSTGTLQLMVLAGASLTDLAGNPLDTTSAIAAATTIDVTQAPPPSPVRRIRVFLVGGQSNADGRAAVSGLPTSPVNLQLPQADIDFYYKVEGKTPALTTLRPGLSETGQFGPEIALGRRLADALADGTTSRVAIIKYANGGTNLYSQWKGGGNATTTGDGSEYLVFQQTVTGGLAALAAAYPGATIEIEGMLWVQGESDAGTQAINYQANLSTFIADIRATYGASIWFVISRLSSAQTAIDATSLATIRAAQSAVALASPLNTLLDTDSFGTNTDHLHFSALGQQQIGNGAGLLLLDLRPFTSQPNIAPQSGGNLKIQVQNVFPGFLYTLRSSLTLQQESWDFVESITAGSAAIEFTVTPSVSETRRFYRVERTLAP